MYSSALATITLVFAAGFASGYAIGLEQTTTPPPMFAPPPQCTPASAEAPAIQSADPAATVDE